MQSQNLAKKTHDYVINWFNSILGDLIKVINIFVEEESSSSTKNLWTGKGWSNQGAKRARTLYP